MKLFVTIYDDARLLIHLLRHYERAEIAEFFIATPPTFAPEVTRFVGLHNIVLVEGLDVADSMGGGTAAVSEMRRRYQGPDEWVTIVDLDEFIDFPCDVNQILRFAEAEGANVIRGTMYDRLSLDGALPAIEPNSNLPQLFPVKSRLTKNLMRGADWKGVLVRGLLNSAPGWGHHHFEKEKVCSLELEIAHYKWNDRAIERLERAHEELVRTGVEFAVEYKRVIDHYKRYGRFRWRDFGGVLIANHAHGGGT